MTIKRQISFEVDGASDAVLEPAVRALADMRCYRFRREDSTVTARTPINWRSIGELMTVRLVPAGADRTRLEVSSESALRTVLFDWGKNAHNLKRFEAAFRARLALRALMD